MRNPTTIPTSAEALMLQMAQNTQQECFRWDITQEMAQMIIAQAYTIEVQSRKVNILRSQNLAEIIAQVAAHMVNPKKSGMIFMGGVGCGKTTMVYAMRRAHNYLYPNHSDKGIVIVDSSDIIQQAQRGKKESDYKTTDDLLAIDDLGKEPTEINIYGSIVQPIVEIFEQRYNRMLPTLVTTNLQRKKVSEKYGRRIADRFNEMFTIVNFPDESYRGRNL